MRLQRREQQKIQQKIKEEHNQREKEKEKRMDADAALSNATFSCTDSERVGEQVYNVCEAVRDSAAKTSTHAHRFR